MDANINGLRNLLDHAVAQTAAGTPVRGFLFFSSSEIYGDPVAEAIPTPETYRGNVSCTGPRACYDESKRYGETLCVNFAQQHGLPVTMARPFNNYGPGMKITDGSVIADLARNMIAGHDLVLYSDGSPTRTFCYVADAVTGYFLALGKGGAGEPYNVGIDGPETSMADLAENVARLGRELFGYQGEGRPRGEPREGIPDRQPQPAQPRHHQGAHPARFRPQGRSRGGLATHPALVRRKSAAGRKHEQDGRRQTEDGSAFGLVFRTARASLRSLCHPSPCPRAGKGPGCGAAGSGAGTPNVLATRTARRPIGLGSGL